MAGDVDRQWFLYRPGRDVGLRDLVVLAVVTEEILGKGAVEDVAELFGHLQIGSDIDAKPLEFVGLVAGADTEHQAPVRQRVGGCDLGREPRRIVEWQDDDRSAEPDSFGDWGAMRDHHQRRRAQAVVGEMMLGEPGDRVAEFVSKPSLLRDLGKDLRCRLFGVARPHQIEDAILHRPLPRFACCNRGRDTQVRQAPGFVEWTNIPRITPGARYRRSWSLIHPLNS
jgi:hypothetical protein